MLIFIALFCIAFNEPVKCLKRCLNLPGRMQVVTASIFVCWFGLFIFLWGGWPLFLLHTFKTNWIGLFLMFDWIVEVDAGFFSIGDCRIILKNTSSHILTLFIDKIMDQYATKVSFLFSSLFLIPCCDFACWFFRFVYLFRIGKLNDCTLFCTFRLQTLHVKTFWGRNQ